MRPHITALRELKRVIENVPEDLLHMRWWQSRAECGTVRCAGGWAAVDPWFNKRGLTANDSGAPRFRGEICDGALRPFFRLTVKATRDLFALYHPHPIALEGHAVSKRQVLNQIDRILAGQPTKPYRIYKRRAP